MKLYRVLSVLACLALLLQPAPGLSARPAPLAPLAALDPRQSAPAREPQAPAAPQQDILGDLILYDGEIGSAPMRGGSWAVGTGGAILRSDTGSWYPETSPTLQTLRGLSMAADKQLWAVGDGGTLLHMNPATQEWLLDPSPVTSDLTGLSSTSSYDLWACGKGGVLLHSNGLAWQSVPSGTLSDLFAISALSASRVWAAGAGGLVLSYNGSAWTATLLPGAQTLRAIYAFAENDVYAAGDQGSLAHWDGSAWTVMTSPGLTANLYGLAATAPGEAWAVGQGGTILHYTTSVWSAYPSPTSADLYAIRNSGGGLVAAGAQGTHLLLNYDLNWLSYPSISSADLFAIRADFRPCSEYLSQTTLPGGGHALLLEPDPWHAPSLVLYCAGQDPLDFTAYDTLDFTLRLPSGTANDPTFWASTWGFSSQTLHLQNYIQGGQIDEQWRHVRIPIADLQTPDWRLSNVQFLNWSPDPTRPNYEVDDITLRDTTPPVLAFLGAETDTLLHLQTSERYRPATVRPLANYTLASPSDPAYSAPTHPLETGLYYHVVGMDGSGIPVNTYQFYLRFAYPLHNGQTYTLHVQDVANASGIVAAPLDFPFTYDDRGQLSPYLKVNQEGYTLDAPKIGHVGGYVGDLGGTAFAVGDGGTILHWDKTNAWTSATSPSSARLNAVAAIREDEAWAAGEDGTLLHWDGLAWQSLASPVAQDLRGLAIGPDGRGWAVGAGGVILGYDGQVWSQAPSPTLQNLNAVWSHSCEGGLRVCSWAVGDAGTVLRYSAGAWAVYPQTLTSENLYALNGPTEASLRLAGAHGTYLAYLYGGLIAYPAFPAGVGDLRAVVTDAGNAAWLAGADGTILHSEIYGSTPFAPLALPTSAPIYGLAYQHARQQWAVGADGLILSGEPGGWKQAASPVSTTLRAVTVLPAGVLRLPKTGLPAVIIQDAATATPVFSAPLLLTAANWYLGGEDVYAFDFSELRQPGRYRAYLPGVGLSDPFQVSEHALDYAAYTTARGLYYQRSGMALAAPFAEARFARPTSFEWDPAGRMLAAYNHFSEESSPLYNGEVTGSGRDAHGGWFDAGDYNKYEFDAAMALWYLFSVYDIGGPAQFPDGGWNIPESGNGVPDLLDEARWETDWISRTLASDGGMYFKVTSECWWYDMPETDNRPQYFTGKTTYDTATAAAVLAAASRLWQPYDAQLSASYLQQALKAWNFLQTHPANLPAGGWFNPPSICTGGGVGDQSDSEDGDNRAWAAAELYRASGDPVYRAAFEAWWAQPLGWNSGIPYVYQAIWAYLDNTQYPTDPEIRAQLLPAMLADAKEELRLTYDSPYPDGFRLDVPDWIGWGHFNQSTTYAHTLLLAWHLTGEQKYYTAAQLNLNVVLGDNPLSFSFITGLGARYPMHLLQGQSVFDTVAEPVPGMPISGTATHLSNGNGLYRAAQLDSNNYPPTYDSFDPFPALRRYVDYPWLIPMSETGIVTIAQNAAVFGLLAQPLTRPASRNPLYLPLVAR